MSAEKVSLIGRPARFRADFYTTRLMPPRGWTGTIEDVRRSSGQGVTSYIVLLDEPFRSQDKTPEWMLVKTKWNRSEFLQSCLIFLQ